MDNWLLSLYFFRGFISIKVDKGNKECVFHTITHSYHCYEHNCYLPLKMSEHASNTCNFSALCKCKKIRLHGQVQRSYNSTSVGDTMNNSVFCNKFTTLLRWQITRFGMHNFKLKCGSGRGMNLKCYNKCVN